MRHRDGAPRDPPSPGRRAQVRARTARADSARLCSSGAPADHWLASGLMPRHLDRPSLPERRRPKMNSYIAVEGPIAVGKTTLVQRMQERAGAEVIYDISDNPYLAEFYKERPTAAF